MTQNANRSAALVLSALIAVTLWMPTVTVPADHAEFAVANATVELA